MTRSSVVTAVLLGAVAGLVVAAWVLTAGPRLPALTFAQAVLVFVAAGVGAAAGMRGARS